MIQRRKRLDAVSQQFVEQAVVEIEAFWIWRAGAFREDARPCDRKPIGLCAQRLHQLNVFLVQVIMVGRGVAVAVIGDGAARVGEAVPDRRAAAVFVDGALDLIGRGRRAPQKAVRKTGRGCSPCSWYPLPDRPVPDPADSADIPSADQPAILPNWRRENLLNGITSRRSRRDQICEQKQELTLMLPALKQAKHRFHVYELCNRLHRRKRRRLAAK